MRVLMRVAIGIERNAPLLHDYDVVNAVRGDPK